jgi:hypothetical protein
MTLCLMFWGGSAWFSGFMFFLKAFSKEAAFS